jgi:transcriptional regulator with XRE-family HTH domain
MMHVEATMNFQDLHDLLRQELLRRIDRGDLTGTALARDAGFQQAHISNFLRGRRSLSQQGLDRVLAAQHLTVGELIEDRPRPLELSASAGELGAAEPGSAEHAIPVVSPAAAMEEPLIRPDLVIETVSISRSRLDGNRAQPSARAAHWQRFVAIRADGAQAAAMDPVIPAGATVVMDRHYNSLAPYRARQRNVCAVRTGAGPHAALVLRYVDLDAGMLILRPLSAGFPVQLLALGPRDRPEDAIVGRVCLVLAEL